MKIFNFEVCLKAGLKGLCNHQLKNNKELLHEYYKIIKEQRNVKTIEAVEDYKTGVTYYLPH